MKWLVKLFVVAFIVTNLYPMNICSASSEVVQNSFDNRIVSNQTVTRMECVKRVLNTVGLNDSNALDVLDACVEPVPFTDFMPKVDYGYVVIAYIDNITYGKYLTHDEAELKNQIVALKREEFFQSKGNLRNITITYNEIEDGWMLEDGTIFPDELIGYAEGAYFAPDDNVTYSECVAFMVRCLERDNESYIDLDVVWAHSRNIGLIKEQDTFFNTPNDYITQESFSILLNRFIENESFKVIYNI